MIGIAAVQSLSVCLDEWLVRVRGETQQSGGIGRKYCRLGDDRAEIGYETEENQSLQGTGAGLGEEKCTLCVW